MTLTTIDNKINNRVPELDIIKFFGILLVVLGHVTRMYTPKGLITPVVSSTELEMVTNVIYAFHMPLFVFVSGMTFCFVSLKKDDYHSFGSFSVNKIKRLMIPYFVFALFWVMPFMVGYGFRSFFPYLTNGLLLSLDSRHLWYVWMLFNVFILFWTIRHIIKKFHMPVWVIIFVSGIIFLIRSRYSICPYFQIDNALTYQFWFTIGYFAMHYKLLFRLCTPIIICIGLVAVGYMQMGGVKQYVYALSGIYIFYFFVPFLGNITSLRFFYLVNRNSFGIYLFHPIIIYLLFYYFSKFSIDPFLFTTITFVVSMAFSILFTELVRYKRWGVIIGEKTKFK